MAGRKPKPTHLKLLQGNPGKRPINATEPKPLAEAPEMPDHLADEAKAEWHRMSPQLQQLGLLTSIDRAAFAGYCVAYGRCVEAERALKLTGPVVKAPSGYPMLSPYLNVANKALEQMRAFLAEFGMTPASRSRLSIKGKEGDDSTEDYLFGS